MPERAGREGGTLCVPPPDLNDDATACIGLESPTAASTATDTKVLVACQLGAPNERERGPTHKRAAITGEVAASGEQQPLKASVSATSDLVFRSIGERHEEEEAEEEQVETPRADAEAGADKVAERSSVESATSPATGSVSALPLGILARDPCLNSATWRRARELSLSGLSSCSTSPFASRGASVLRRGGDRMPASWPSSDITARTKAAVTIQRRWRVYSLRVQRAHLLDSATGLDGGDTKIDDDDDDLSLDSRSTVFPDDEEDDDGSVRAETVGQHQAADPSQAAEPSRLGVVGRIFGLFGFSRPAVPVESVVSAELSALSHCTDESSWGAVEDELSSEKRDSEGEEEDEGEELVLEEVDSLSLIAALEGAEGEGEADSIEGHSDDDGGAPPTQPGGDDQPAGDDDQSMGEEHSQQGGGQQAGDGPGDAGDGSDSDSFDDDDDDEDADEDDEDAATQEGDEDDDDEEDDDDDDEDEDTDDKEEDGAADEEEDDDAADEEEEGGERAVREAEVGVVEMPPGQLGPMWRVRYTEDAPFLSGAAVEIVHAPDEADTAALPDAAAEPASPLAQGEASGDTDSPPSPVPEADAQADAVGMAASSEDEPPSPSPLTASPLLEAPMISESSVEPVDHQQPQEDAPLPPAGDDVATVAAAEAPPAQPEPSISSVADEQTSADAAEPAPAPPALDHGEGQEGDEPQVSVPESSSPVLQPTDLPARAVSPGALHTAAVEEEAGDEEEDEEGEPEEDTEDDGDTESLASTAEPADDDVSAHGANMSIRSFESSDEEVEPARQGVGRHLVRVVGGGLRFLFGAGAFTQRNGESWGVGEEAEGDDASLAESLEGGESLRSSASLADSEGGDSTASLAGSAAVDDDDESSLEGEDDDNEPLPAVPEEPGQAGIPTAADRLSPSQVPVPVAEEASEVEPTMSAREPAGTAAGRDAVAASPVTLWEGGAALVPDQAGEPGQHHHATVPVLAAQQPCSAVPVLHGSEAPPAEEESAVPAPLWQGMLGAGFGSFLGGGGGDFSLIQPPTTSPGGGSRFQRLFQGRTGAAEEEDEAEEEEEGAGALSSEAFSFSTLAQSQALLMTSSDGEDVAGQVDLSFLQQAAEDAEHHAGEDFPGASRVLDMLLTDEEEEAAAAPEEQPKAIERVAAPLLSAVHAASSPAVEQVAAESESESASSVIKPVAAAPVEPQAPVLSLQAQPPATTAAAPSSSPVRGKKVVVLKGATGEASTTQPKAAVQPTEAPATKEPSPAKAAAASKSGEGKKESSSSKSPARAAKAPSREEEKEGLAVAKSADSPVKNDADSKEAKSPARPSKKDSSPARSSKLEAEAEEEDPCAAALRRVDEMLAASEERAAADRRAARAKGSPERASKSRPTSGRRRKLRVSPNTMPEELVEAAESIDADVWDRWNTMSDDSGRSSATSSSSYIVGCSPPALMDELLAPVIKQQHEEEEDDDDQPVEAETPAQDVVKTEEAAPAADEEQLEAATEGSEGSGSEGSGSDRSSPRDYEKSRGDSLLSVQSADEDVLGRAVSEAVFVDAVCRVQGLWRGALARKVSARLRVACTSRQRRQEAVTAIQRLARRHWAYRKAKAFIHAMLETRSALDKLQQEREAAEKLQAWARGRMAVRRYQCLVRHHRSGLKVAVAMQCMWRGRVSRRASQALLAKARLLKTWCVAYHRGRMCRRRYLGMRAAVRIVQLRFRHKRRRREAAICLQAAARGFVKQRKWRRVQMIVLYMQRLLRVRLNRRRRAQCQAATKLQAQARATIQRRAFLSLRTHRATQALLIQRAWRRWRCLSQYRKLRDRVIRLQAVARQRAAASKFRADVRLIVMLQQRVRHNQQRQHAAITLQRVVRGHAARVDLALHNAAAMKLQAVLLLFLTRKWATEGRAAWRDAHRWTGVFRSRRHSNPIVRAVVEVQAAFRMRRAARLLILYRFLRKALGEARVRLARRKARRNQLRCAAAIVIQCKARCRAARKAAAQKRCALIVAQKMVSTTLVMQRCWRGHQGRRIARARRQELQEAAHQKEREDAALLLQSVRRGLLARRELAVLRTLAAAAAKHKAEEDARIKLRSIVRIQRCIRAYRFRRSLRYRLVLSVVCSYERLQGDRFARAVLLLQRLWRARRQARLQVEQAATTATQADGAAVEEEAEARVISLTTRAPLQASAPAANVAQDKAADEPSRLPGRLWGAHRRVMTWSIGLGRTSSSRRREEAAEPAPPVAAPTPAVAAEADTTNNKVEPVDSSPAQHERAASSSSASSSSSDSKAAKTSADSKFPQLLGLLRRKRATVQSQQPQAAAAAQGSQVAEATQTAEDAAPSAADVAELEQLAKEAALADVLLLEKEVDEAAAEAINAMDEDDMLLLQELGGGDKVEEEREVLATVQEDDEEDEDEEVAMEQAGDHSLGLKEPDLEHRPRQERTRSGRLIKWLRRKQSDRDLAAASTGAATVGEPVPAGEGEAEGEAVPQLAGGRQPSYWSFEGLVNGRVKRSESMGVNKARELDAQEPAQEGGDKQLVRRSPLRRSTREDAGLAREHVPEEGGGVEQEEEDEEEADDNASFYSSYSHAHSSPDKGATHRSRNSSQASTLTADMDGSGSSSNAARQSWWPLSRGSRSWSFQRQSSRPEVEGEQDGKARGLESGGRHRQRQQLAQSSDHQAALDGSSGPRARAVSLQVVQETLPATALSPNPELLVLPRRGSIAPSAPPAPGQGHAAKDSLDNSNQASTLSPNPELLTLGPDKEGDKSHKNHKQAIRHVHSSVQTDEEGPEPQHDRAHRSNSSELPPTHLLPNPELLDLRPSAAPHGKADKHVRNAHTSTREAGDDEEDEEGGGQQEAGLSPNPELLVLSHLDHVPSRRRASRRDSSASFDENGLLQFRKPGPLATVVSGDGSEEAAAEETGASVDSNGLLDLRKHGEEEEEGVMPGPLDIPPSCLPFNLLGLLSTQTPESSRPPHRRGSEAGSEVGAGPRSALSGSSAMEIGSVRIPPNKGNKAGSVGSAQGPAGKPQRAAKVMDKLTDFLLPTGPSASRTDPAAIRTAGVPSQQPKARTGEQPVVPATRGGKVRRKDGGEQVRRPDRTKPLQPRNYNYDVDPRAMRRQTVLSARELERLDATNAYISDVWGKNARRLSKDVEDSQEYRDMLRQQRRQERGGMNRLTPVTTSSAGRRRRKQFFEPDGEYEELLREAAEVVEAHNGRREARAMAQQQQQQQHYAPTAQSRRSSGGTAPTAGSSSAKRSRASPSPHYFTPVPSPGPPPMLGTSVPSPAPAPFTATDPVVQQHRRQRSSGSTGTAVMYTAPVLGYGGGSGGTSLTVPRVRQQDMQPLTSAAEHARARSMQSEDGVAWGQVIVDEYAHSIGMGQESGGVRELIDNMMSAPTDRAAQATGMSMLRYYSREPGACRELCRREGLRAISDAMRYHFSENTILEDAVEILTRLTTQSPEMRSRVKAGLPAYTQDLLVHAKSKFMPKSRASQACDQLLRLLRPSSISN